MIEIPLTPSKSIALRLIALHAAAGKPLRGEQWDFCDDTAALRRGLALRRGIVSAGAGAAPFRFMAAIFASTPEADLILSGTPRLLQRPISPLVEALKELGADIALTPEGLAIKGKDLRSDRISAEVNLDCSLSSQFCSALLLASPLLPPLKIKYSGLKASLPYLEMTIEMLRRFGADVDCSGREISVKTPPALKGDEEPFPEADWSAASYFYEISLLMPDVPIFLQGLLPPSLSLQGDSRCAAIFHSLGVDTRYEGGGAIIRYSGAEGSAHPLILDMRSVPDLVPAAVAACLIARRHFSFEGVETLRYKESDRLLALCEACEKLGYSLRIGKDTISWDGIFNPPLPGAVIETKDDHRIAMAMTPLAALANCGARLDNPEVVKKSFPDFYKLATPLLQNL